MSESVPRKAGRVVVFGSVNVDLIVQIPYFPQPGETVGGGTFFSAPGGKGANQALAAARAGAQVDLVGAVGRDAHAEQALTLLKAEGVDLQGVQRVPDSTGVAFIMVDSAGENQIATASGANYAARPPQGDSLRLTGRDLLLTQLEMDLEATQAALQQAKTAGAMSLLNMAPLRSEALDLLPLADVVVLNHVESEELAEAMQLDPQSNDSRALTLAKETGARIIITLGHEGLMAADGERLITLPAPAITMVDSVGAGDAFCGYLAAGLLEKPAFDVEALAMAATAGALACTQAGAQPAIPHRAAVESALARQQR
ncbi:MAG: ribokinase [Pseudomonadota bacterium]